MTVGCVKDNSEYGVALRCIAGGGCRGKNEAMGEVGINKEDEYCAFPGHKTGVLTLLRLDFVVS